MHRPTLGILAPLVGFGWATSASTLTSVGEPVGQQPVQFADAIGEAGLEFLHQHASIGERYMVETMGSGLAMPNLDVDGWLDVCGGVPPFVRTTIAMMPLPRSAKVADPQSALW